MSGEMRKFSALMLVQHCIPVCDAISVPEAISLSKISALFCMHYLFGGRGKYLKEDFIYCTIKIRKIQWMYSKWY